MATVQQPSPPDPLIALVHALAQADNARRLLADGAAVLRNAGRNELAAMWLEAAHDATELLVVAEEALGQRAQRGRPT